jgi:cobaltochelatase CobN
MGKILFVTNIESNSVGFNEAIEGLRGAPGKSELVVYQIEPTELWNKKWQQEIAASDFVLFTWMGTGLDCDFLKKTSAYMQKNKKKHLYNVMAAGDDLLEFGISDEEKNVIKKYFSFGGLENYQNLCKWLCNTFSQKKYQAISPKQLPWAAIYHPDETCPVLDLGVYFEKHCKKGQPTIGFIFSREDWLWGKLEYQNAIILELEKQGCNVIGIFTNNMANVTTGAPSLAENMTKYFYCDDRVIIDALINPFVFSLTVAGFLQLADLQKLGVPILQIVNLYMDFKWWEKNMVGLTANEVSYNVAMPEFDGVLHSVPVSSREEAENGEHYRKAIHDRINMLARKAKKWANLRHKNNKDKKIAIVFHNYPPTNSNIGSAACLDSIESVRLLLEKMQQQGYSVDNIPVDSQSFIENVTAHATNDRRYISQKLIENANAKLTKEEYQVFFAKQPQKTQEHLVEGWGKPPGEVFRYGDDIIVPGMLNGNIFVTVQPPRGFGDDPGKIYHDPVCAPTHQYLGVYYWIRDVWQADAMIHVGTHGNLEWLPGKGNAMSNTCYPDIATGDMPNVYPYWITCVGEGIQAKRRSAACLISYLSAPMSISGTYEELADLEQLLDEYCHFKNDADVASNMESIKNMIRAKATECNLDEDVPESATNDFDDYVGQLHVYMTDIKNMQMSIGLHTLGIPPEGEEFTEYLLALTKVDNGDIPSLTKTVALMYGYDYYELLENSGKMLPDGSKTYGMLLDDIRIKCTEVITKLTEHAFEVGYAEDVFTLSWTINLHGDLRDKFLQVVKYICTQIAPSLLQTTLEMDNTLNALNGCYIDPCPSGAPTSGGADLLPTGRNFYSIDPRVLPTTVAWEIGKQMADDVIGKFIAEEGRYPESVGIILWATSNLRNHGQCVAEFLYLMGLRPVWQKGSMRVVGLEVIPLAELKRPRVDVTGRISGLFRDSMPASVTWMDEAVNMVGNLDEDLEMNFVRKHILEEVQELEEQGIDKKDAWRQASFRIFGDPPGAHGAGTGAVLEAKNWETIDDIAEVYTRWGGHAYGEGSEGSYMPDRFKKRMSQIDITVQNVDHRESSMLSGDDYNNYRGGMIAAVRSYKGEMPKNYVSDSSDRSKVQLRTLDQELKRWFRGEAMNPKYIQGMKKHGYKGAGDLATYVAVSYQWDATSDVMEDWMYEKYAEKYAFNEEIQKWMKEVNPWALQRITEVLLEAEQRGLWKAKQETKEELQKLFLSLEGELEEKGDK